MDQLGTTCGQRAGRVFRLSRGTMGVEETPPTAEIEYRLGGGDREGNPIADQIAEKKGLDVPIVNGKAILLGRE